MDNPRWGEQIDKTKQANQVMSYNLKYKVYIQVGQHSAQ